MSGGEPSNPTAGSDAATSCDATTQSCQQYVWQWDPPYTEDFKQYVNLPEEAGTTNGPNAFYKGHIEPRAPNITVTFTVVPNAANENAAATASLNPGSASTDELGEASVLLALPQHGGLKFKVGGKTDSMADPVNSGEAKVWRKIDYTLACMLRPDGSNYSNRVTEATLVSEYDKAFIELNRVGSLATPAHEPLIERDTCQTWAAAELPASADRKLDFGLIDTLAKGAPIPFTREYNPAPYNSFTTTFNGSSWTFDISSKAAWLDSAVYYDSNDPGTAHDVSGQVSMTRNGLNFDLSVDLSAVVTGGVPLNRIRLVLQMKKRDFLSGLSWGPVTLVAMRWREAGYVGQEGDATMHTMLHEAGHFHNLVPNTLFDGPNSYYYDATAWGVGGGPHCSADVENPANSAALPATPTCIMYHEFRFTMTFCEHCLKALRAENLTNP